jgi:hypothetical protein
MGKKPGDESPKKNTFINKSKDKITACDYVGNECTCTNINGRGCLKKQDGNDCLHKKLGPKQKKEAA